MIQIGLEVVGRGGCGSKVVGRGGYADNRCFVGTLHNKS